MPDDERYLTPAEVNAIIFALQIKYRTEAEMIQRMIERDIKMHGRLTRETKRARKEFIKKIMSEKENYNGKLQN